MEKGNGSKELKDNKCPRCIEEFTLAQIKKICVDTKGTTLIMDTKIITDAIVYLNKYRIKANLNTCVRKAHFLAQIAQESKF